MNTGRGIEPCPWKCSTSNMPRGPAGPGPGHHGSRTLTPAPPLHTGTYAHVALFRTPQSSRRLPKRSSAGEVRHRLRPPRQASPAVRGENRGAAVSHGQRGPGTRRSRARGNGAGVNLFITATASHPVVVTCTGVARAQSKRPEGEAYTGDAVTATATLLLRGTAATSAATTGGRGQGLDVLLFQLLMNL